VSRNLPCGRSRQKIDLDNLRQLLLQAEESHDVITAEELKADIEKAELWNEAPDREVLVAQILVEDNEVRYRQAFFDIADNAKRDPVDTQGDVRSRQAAEPRIRTDHRTPSPQGAY